MWLVLDIGNSAVKGGFFEGDQLKHPCRISWPGKDAPASLETAIEEHLRGRSVTRAGIASVVPEATPRVQALLVHLAKVEAEMVHHQMRLPFTLAYQTPHTLGADRLAAATAAWTRYGQDESRAVVALDAGTAVTSDVVDLGGRGDVVDVADGFARNYLLPQKYAIKANDGALEAAESIRETRLAAERKAKNLAEAIATQLVGSRVVLAAQAGDEGQLYGSVSVADVVEGIRRFTGIELDKSQVEMDESIKAIGLHEIQIKVHTEVEFPLTLDIIPA